MAQVTIEEDLRLAVLHYLVVNNVTQITFAYDTNLCPKNLNKFLQGDCGTTTKTMNIMLQHMQINFVHPNLKEQIDENAKKKKK